ncbi:MAG TPA: hypothetical protein VN192_05710 [Flavobacterium sp.]|nr:hypothetical protein [Flavobacterium sp.]
MQKFELGQTVYHRSVYEHKEPLKIVGILEDKLLLEGYFSGGTHNVVQRDWLPIKGVSRVYNHKYKQECRKSAIAIQALSIPVDRNHDNMTKTMFDLLDMVLVLTSDITLNPECE